MKYRLPCSLKGGRSVSRVPTRTFLPDVRKVEDVKKEELQKIVDNKPAVDSLIQKVGKVKLKPKVVEALKENDRKAAEYVKKLRKKPKNKISFEF